MRVKDGIYYIIPFEKDPESFMPDWHLLAEYLVKGTEFYIGYYSALQIHGLIIQPSLERTNCCFKADSTINNENKGCSLPVYLP